MVPGCRPLLRLAKSITIGRFSLSSLDRMQGEKIMVFITYIITLNFFLMFPFVLLLVPFSCLSYLYLLIRLATKTNPDSLA